MRITSRELNKLLVDKLPNLQQKYAEEISWQEGDETGSHVVYGDVLTPYLSECISKDNQKALKLVFGFLENLLELNDEYVTEVVSFSVLESLACFMREKDYLTIYLGQKCKEILDEIN